MLSDGLGPEPLDDGAVADPLDAGGGAGLGAQPLLGVLDVGGRAAVQARDRDVAGVVVQASRSARLRVISASGTSPPHMPEWTAWVSVRTSMSTRTRPRRLVVSAGTPMSQLPESAITMTSAAQPLLVLLEQRRAGCRSRPPPRPR